MRAGKLLNQWKAVVFVGLVFLSAAAAAQAPPASDDPDLVALLAARSVADSYIAQGNYTGAIMELLQSLRDAPGDRAELADTAYGNGQMISYVLLHLMPESDAYRFAEKGFEPDTYETDKMVRTLCILAIGLSGKDNTDQSRDAMYLTSSENKLVRAITLFQLSNPYFYANEDFTGQHAALLAREYPDSELAQTALNFPLYAARETGDFDAVAKARVSKRLESPPYKTWSGNLRARIQASAENLSDTEAAPSRAEALQPLLRGITDAWDWRERYFSLLLLKSEFGGSIGGELRAAARTLAASESNTPDAVEARIELARALSADCAGDPGNTDLRDEVFNLAQVLLEKGVTELTPERVLWETWAQSLQNCAGNLASAGHAPEARAIYQALAERLPGSKVAAACEAAMAELSIGPEPDALRGAAQ